jgi:hypothetical protein
VLILLLPSQRFLLPFVALDTAFGVRPSPRLMLQKLCDDTNSTKLLGNTQEEFEA